MADSRKSKKTRGPRRSSAELRQLLISTGQEIIRSEGLGTGIDGVTFKKVLNRIKERDGITVTHASFLGRIFENQAEFQGVVLAELVSTINNAEFSDVAAVVVPLLETVDLHSLKSRRHTLNEISRLGAIAEEATIRNDPSWPIWLSVVASELTSRDSLGHNLKERLNGVLRQETADFAMLYGEILKFLGMRIKAHFTIENLTVAIASIAEGAAMRSFVAPDIFTPVALSSSESGTTTEWTILGLGIRALSELMVEPIPGWTPPDEFDVA